MSDLSPDEVKYQEEYKAAMEQLDSAEAGKAPASITEEVKTEPVQQEEVKALPDAAKVDDENANSAETLAEMRARLEKAEKALKDTQAWGTKNAQQLAEIRREREEQQRAASRPAILDEQPELAEAIKHVVSDPAPRRQVEDAHQTWLQTIEAAHPGIFAADADPELVDALVAKRDASGDAWNDPLVAIRDIAAEKIAFAERQAVKRYEVEAKAKAAKTAMSVPGTGGSPARVPKDTSQEEADRWKNMSDADFDKEVKKVKGF